MREEISLNKNKQIKLKNKIKLWIRLFRKLRITSFFIAACLDLKQ